MEEAVQPIDPPKPEKKTRCWSVLIGVYRTRPKEIERDQTGSTWNFICKFYCFDWNENGNESENWIDNEMEIKRNGWGKMKRNWGLPKRHALRGSFGTNFTRQGGSNWMQMFPRLRSTRRSSCSLLYESTWLTMKRVWFIRGNEKYLSKKITWSCWKRECEFERI